MSSFQNYGSFDETNKCFHLTNEPPRKWWNLHCTAIGDVEMYSEVAHINDGPTWVRDKDGVTVNLTSYDSTYQYIRDDESGTVFCPSGHPAPTAVADRKIDFYLDKTVMSGSCEGLKATQRVFVPQHKPVECTTITIENTTDKPRKISVFSYAMFALNGTDSEGRGVWKENFTEVHEQIGGVFCTNRLPGLPSDRFKAFLITLNEEFFNGNGYRDQFTRAEFSLGSPKILWGWDCDGRPGYGPDCAGVVQVKLTLAPGETRRVDFLLGQAGDVAEVSELRRGTTPEMLDEWCEEVRRVEHDRSEAFKIDVGQPLYNGLFNIFLKKQLYNYLINKSGFRDNLQVDYALAFADYDAAENNLLRALASQYDTGSVPHGFRPLNRLQYSDKPAWILMTLPGLLKEKGDFDLLEKVVPYFESTESGTVWDHALRAMRFLAKDTGANGLCDQHHADWNDGLEATPESGERESVMVTMQFCYGCREIAEVARRIGDKDIEEEATKLYEDFKNRLNDVAWDGEWYIRTICGDGYRIGSKECQEGQIYLNPQSWAVLSGVAEGERAQQVMRKVDEILEMDLGYRICYPPYAQYDPRVGRMSNSMPGSNENGGCYNHAAGFKGVADCLLGRAEQAWAAFAKVTPDNPDNPISNSGAEPFSYVNSYSTVPYVYGASGYAWRTGTSGWFAKLMIEYILGARRGYDGLIIDPCLPEALPQAGLTRKFRGATYEISLENPGKASGAKPREITLNGEKLEGNLLPDKRDGVHQVKVVI